MIFSDIVLPKQSLRYDGNDQKLTVVMADTTRTGVTGITTGDVTLSLSKAGAVFATPNDGAWAELSNGFYTVTLDENDCDTLGTIVLLVDDGTNPVTIQKAEVGIDATDQWTQYLRVRGFFKERK